MDRDSSLYKFRRKLQVLAHHMLSEKMLAQIYGRVVLGKWLNLDKPQTFNEKISWLKLYHFPFNPLAIQCADKFAVRDYIRSKGFGNILVPHYGVWDSSDEIDWESLPDQFVLPYHE